MKINKNREVKLKIVIAHAPTEFLNLNQGIFIWLNILNRKSLKLDLIGAGKPV